MLQQFRFSRETVVSLYLLLPAVDPEVSPFVLLLLFCHLLCILLVNFLRLFSSYNHALLCQSCLLSLALYRTPFDLLCQFLQLLPLELKSVGVFVVFFLQVLDQHLLFVLVEVINVKVQLAILAP